MTRAQAEAYIEERFPDYIDKILFLDGFDEAFVGVVSYFGREPVACYDRDKCIEVLIKGGMTHEEAEDFFSYNTEGAWVGEFTPAFITKI